MMIIIIKTLNPHEKKNDKLSKIVYKVFLNIHTKHNKTKS